MVKATEKLSVLSAEAPLNQPMLTDGSAFYQLQEELRGAFEATVIDLPRHMMIQHPHLLHDVQSVVVVVELTLASARDAIRVLSWLKANVPSAQVILVANRAQPAGVAEISRKEFEDSVERKLDMVVPFDAKLFSQAAKLGKPLAEIGKNGKTTQPIAELARRLSTAGDGEGEEGGPSKGKSLLGKMGDFTSMLPKRKPKS
jgi:pilus assembly protein CpaE